jgi:hypothetical protein
MASFAMAEFAGGGSDTTASSGPRHDVVWGTVRHLSADLQPDPHVGRQEGVPQHKWGVVLPCGFTTRVPGGLIVCPVAG